MREVFEKYDDDNSEMRAVVYLQTQVNNYYNNLFFSNEKRQNGCIFFFFTDVMGLSVFFFPAGMLWGEELHRMVKLAMV